MEHCPDRPAPRPAMNRPQNWQSGSGDGAAAATENLAATEAIAQIVGAPVRAALRCFCFCLEGDTV